MGWTGVDSLTRQGQGLGEPHEGDVVVVLLVAVVAVDDDLGNGGGLRKLAQVVGACVHLPTLQDLLLGPARAPGEHGPLTRLAEPTGSICYTRELQPWTPAGGQEDG